MKDIKKDIKTETITLAGLEWLGRKYESMSSGDRAAGIKQMLEESQIAEGWVMAMFPKLRCNRGEDTTQTDLITPTGQTVEVKFRSGPLPDDRQSTGNIFLERSVYGRPSRTWRDNPNYYAIVFSTGEVWMLAYRELRRQLQLENTRGGHLIPHKTMTTRYGTWGVVVHWKTLADEGLLKRYNTTTHLQPNNDC